MSVYKRKSRMISFRISDEEYELLRKISQHQGARSVSDYARSALIHVNSETASPESGALEAKITRLDDELQELRTTVQRLTEIVSVEAQCSS